VTGLVPVFVNDRPVRVSAGTRVAEAIALADPALAGLVSAGTASVTDARGLPLDPSSAVHSGAILRVIVRARRSQDETDAHP
jgi:hypothetical protein